MREKEIIQTLKKKVEIPEMVQSKADDAFAKIKSDTRLQKTAHFAHYKKRKLIGKSGAAVALIAILAAGTFTVAAATNFLWSNALLTDMDISEEQKTALEQNDTLDFINQTATNAGVTITVEQTVADDCFAYIAFKIDGYKLPEGAEPAIKEMNVSVGGHLVDCFGSFYNGIVWNENSTPTMADGSEVQYDESGYPVEQYAAEDGSLEYICIINARYLDDYFDPTIIGKNISVEIKDLGTCPQDLADPNDNGTTEVEGCWEFSWQLQGTDDTHHYDFDTEIANTGIKLVSADITPVSIKAAYYYPGGSFDSAIGAPNVTIRMKDGTEIIPSGPGNEGPQFSQANVYALRTSFGKIIDPGEVEALLISVPTSIENDEQQFEQVEIPININ